MNKYTYELYLHHVHAPVLAVGGAGARGPKRGGITDLTKSCVLIADLS